MTESKERPDLKKDWFTIGMAMVATIGITAAVILKSLSYAYAGFEWPTATLIKVTSSLSYHVPITISGSYSVALTAIIWPLLFFYIIRNTEEKQQTPIMLVSMLGLAVAYFLDNPLEESLMWMPIAGALVAFIIIVWMSIVSEPIRDGSGGPAKFMAIGAGMGFLVIHSLIYGIIFGILALTSYAAGVEIVFRTSVWIANYSEKKSDIELKQLEPTK